MQDLATMGLSNLSGVKVLVIEDDPDGRQILVEVLRFAGADVNACSDAYAALDRLKNLLRPDVIVCDLAMPRMDGLTFLRALRSHGDTATRRIPVLAITAYDEFYSPMQLIKLGSDAYMGKPLDLERLCEAVKKLSVSGTRRRGKAA
jgi:two-component system, OmpR family, response regulator MprA